MVGAADRGRTPSATSVLSKLAQEEPMKKLLSCLIPVCFVVSGCVPSEINALKPNGEKVTAMFYPGGNSLDDLLIINGKNHFGKAQYQIDDPLADVGFRFQTGERFQAECAKRGKDIIGQPECKLYVVFRSNFPLLPEKTQIQRPSGA